MGYKNFLALATASCLLLTFLIFDINNPKHTQVQGISQSGSPNPQIRQITTNIYDICREKESTCFENAINSQLLEKYTVGEILSGVYDFDTYFSCHAFTHYLGRALYKKLQNIPDAYSQINFTCHGGTYHGVIEAYLDQQKMSLDSLLGTDIEKVCADSKKLTDKNPNQVFTECLHGFGHAFMFITNSDLPLSLSYCDRLENSENQEKCYGGAFMENSTSSTNLNHPSAWVKEGDKFFPCTVLEPKYLHQCYFYQANYLIMISNHNYQNVFADCSLLDKDHQEYCVLGLGANLASFTNEKGVSASSPVCSMGTPEMAKICISGAISSMMARWGGDPSRIIDFCSSVSLNLRELCFFKIGHFAKVWGYTKDQQDEICSIQSQYEDYCLGKLMVESKY